MPGPIIVVERELLQSQAFRELNGTAKTVLFDFLMKCRVKGAKGKRGGRVILNNGEIEYTYCEAEKKSPPIGRAAFMRSIDALIAAGFIDIAKRGSGGKKGDKSKYAMSDRWRAYGTDDFVTASRPRDKRQGRGFAVYWKKKKQT